MRSRHILFYLSVLLTLGACSKINPEVTSLYGSKGSDNAAAKVPPGNTLTYGSTVPLTDSSGYTLKGRVSHIQTQTMSSGGYTLKGTVRF